MGTLIVIVAIGLIVWFVARSAKMNPEKSRGSASREPADAQFRRDIDEAVSRDYGRGGAAGELRRVSPPPSNDHTPPTPSTATRAAWSPRTSQLEVAGEWYRADNLRQLFVRHATVSESGAEIHLPAVLVPDPSNPFDKNAVAVFVDGFHVGYMERADARRYHASIANLAPSNLEVPSRQWLRGTSSNTWARVTLALPEPAHLQCPNPLPDDAAVLPPGTTVQVTREEQHLEELGKLLKRYGTEAVVAASLSPMTEQRPRSTVELVAVAIDEQQVGVLSPTQTANFMPLAKRAEALGRQLVCRASLRGNALKIDVALHASKAHELNDEQVDAMFGKP